jgi:hypothetical protein
MERGAASLDETTIAIAGLITTLLAGMVGPIIVERMRRKSDRQTRLHDERVAAYGELLAAVSQLTENASTRASIPLADNLPEPDDAVFRRLLGRVRVVAGEDVRRTIDRLQELFARYYADLYLAQHYHRLLERPEGGGDEGKAISQRLALGGIADELRDARKQLEDAIRKDLGV